MSRLKARARGAIARARRLHLAPAAFRRRLRSSGRADSVVYMVEQADWSIRHDGLHLTGHLPGLGVPAMVDVHPSWQGGRVLHFGSLTVFFNHGAAALGGRAPVVVTVFHGDFGLSDGMDAALSMLLDNRARIDRIIVANTMMKDRMARWGVPAETVRLIPLGVDLARFHPADPASRARERAALGLPADEVVIGSFQKDGQGWGEGLDPKLIKGPDVLVETLRLASRTQRVHALLSGPARGYVKAGLDAAGIPWTHRYMRDPGDVADLYRCCDAYVVSSREEGGPKALLEAMACGVPLATTRVGMVPDIIRDGENGRIAPVDDAQALAAALLDALNPSRAVGFRSAGLNTAQRFDWSEIAASYAALYRDLPGWSDHDGEKVT